MRATLPAILALAAVAGCSGSSAPSSQPPAHAPVIPLSAESTAPVSIAGGTAEMRGRARAILAGMGSPAITSIRFGRPPATFKQFRRVPGPIWVTVTVTAPPRDLGDERWRSLAGSARLWQAAVFENAFVRSTPPGERRLRGTTETGATGQMTGAGSGAIGRPEPGASLPTGEQIRSAIEQGVRRSGFGLVSVRLTRSPSVAASVVLRVDRPQGFGRRVAALRQALTAVAPRMDGFETGIVDRCGRPVILWSAASYTDPRWLCPDPYMLGIADCDREPKPDLSC